uniref:Uncharacterized protein n=1 Tax=Anguilla anguilla TaxID=7936 RepID=A0A0E9VWS6_ANGAN
MYSTFWLHFSLNSMNCKC